MKPEIQRTLSSFIYTQPSLKVSHVNDQRKKAFMAEEAKWSAEDKKDDELELTPAPMIELHTPVLFTRLKSLCNF